MPERNAKFSLMKHLLSGQGWRLTGILLLTVVLSLLAMLPPLLIRSIIDRVIIAGDRSLFFGLGVCIVLIPIVVKAGVLMSLYKGPSVSNTDVERLKLFGNEFVAEAIKF